MVDEDYQVYFGESTGLVNETIGDFIQPRDPQTELFLNGIDSRVEQSFDPWHSPQSPQI